MEYSFRENAANEMKEIEKLQQVVKQFCAFVEALPAEATVNKVWGAKEVLPHLLIWQSNYLRLLKTQIANEAATPARGKFNIINEQVVANNRGQSLMELLMRFRDVSNQWVKLAQTVDLDITTLIYKAGSARRPLRWYLRAEANHIQHHFCGCTCLHSC